MASQPQLPTQTVVDLIVYEHNKVRALFKQYQVAETPEEQQVLCWELVREISQHAAKEEMLLYPVLATLAPDARDHCLQEHMQVKTLLASVDSGNVSDPNVAQVFEQAMAALLHHIQEEETQHLPLLAKQVSEAELRDLGMQYHAASVAAPTRPHPEMPNTPPENFKTNPKLLMQDLQADLSRWEGVAHTTTPLVM